MPVIQMRDSARRQSTCKQCGAVEGFRRCHRTWSDRLLSLVRLYPFECNACGAISHRLYLPLPRRQGL